MRGVGLKIQQSGNCSPEQTKHISLRSDHSDTTSLGFFFCYLLPCISAYNYQDKHIEVFFFRVDNLEVSEKENHIDS